QNSFTPQMKQSMLSHIEQMPDQVPGNDDLDSYIALHNAGASTTKAAQEEQKNAAGTFKDTAQGFEAQAQTEKTQEETALYKKMGGTTPEAAAFNAYLQKGGRPEQWSAFKARQEAAATQPYMIQRSQAEAQARMSLEGMAKPVYAFNPKTNEK